jgi:hypothetical protein
MRLRQPLRSELNSAIALENAYFGGLLRFAFKDALIENDALYAFASSRAGIPMPSAYGERLKALEGSKGQAVALDAVWKVDHYFLDEVKALREYLATDNIQKELPRARAAVEIDDTIALLDNTELLMTLHEPTPPTSNPPPTTTPPPTGGNSGGGGGGGGGAFGLEILLLLAALIASGCKFLRSTAKTKASTTLGRASDERFAKSGPEYGYRDASLIGWLVSPRHSVGQSVERL